MLMNPSAPVHSETNRSDKRLVNQKPGPLRNKKTVADQIQKRHPYALKDAIMP
jgi:hypothetical protein